MIQYNFNINQGRCHIQDKGIYIVGGFFAFNNPEENSLKVCLDKKEIPSEVKIFSTPDVCVKYMMRKEAITREYFICIPLPEDYREYKKLRVYTVSADGNEEVLSGEILTSKIQTDQSESDHCVDSVQFRDSKCMVSGWCAAAEPIEVRAYLPDGTRLECEVEWTHRSDVRFLYRESETLEKCGFTISFDGADLEKAILVFKTGEIKTTVKIDVADKKKEWELSQTQKNTLKSKLSGLAQKKYLSRTFEYIRVNGVRRFAKRAYEILSRKPHIVEDISYMEWMASYIPDETVLQTQREHVFDYCPEFSIVVPLYKTPEYYLRELVDSIKAQTYPHWKLYLSDGSGEASPLDDLLTALENEDSRITAIRNGRQLRISENTNQGLMMADGDYIVFADHDDVLTPDALYECAAAINADREIEFIYSDEDKISADGQKYFQPHFKSDFNIDLLRSMNYFCHLCVAKKSLMDHIGMLNSEYDGAQDYDFVLRCVEATTHIHHIPKVLYHWRADDNSTSSNPESKRYAFEAGKNAIAAHCKRMGYDVEVSHGKYPGLYRVKYFWEEKPLISIIIPNKDHTDDLDKCIKAIEKKSTYTNYEYIIVENNSTEPETFEYYKKLEQEVPKVKVVYYEGIFNYSKINNFGAQYAKGDYYLLLNNDIEMINPDCLEEMLSYCMREDVGIVGARLYYPDSTIQHAGVIIGIGGIAGHTFVNFPREQNGYFSRILCAQDYSAVTAACLMVKKSVYEAVGGLSENFKVAFNDIDFCLKVRELGYLVVYNPFAELYHYESKSRGYEDTPEKVARFHSEIAAFIEKWPSILQKGDPYYNINLTLERQDFSLR